MKMFKMCLNPKVMAGLAAAGIAIWMFAPGWFAAALPILFLAICPLSMLLMMKMMMPRSQDAEPAGASAVSTGDAEQLEAQLESLRTQQAALANQLAIRRREETASS